MLKYKNLLLVPLIVVATYGLLYGQNVRSEGSEPYVPTKLEWLALRSTVAFGGIDKVYVTFKPHPEAPDTIQINVLHDSGVSESRVKAGIASAKRAVTHVSKEYHWDWVKMDVKSDELISSLSE